MLATQLLVLASAGFLLRSERKAKAQEPDCAQFTTPCGCTVEGCGWSSRRGVCQAGEITDCMECPNVLLCGDETCVQSLYQDKDALRDMHSAKKCMDGGKDMADCLCTEGGDRLQAKLESSGCCDANEVFSQFCHQRECEAVPDDDCAALDEPCACGLRVGCGWQNGACVAGGATSCEECPTTLVCGSDSCTARTFRDPDFLEAINRGKVCMESLRPTDTFASCIDSHGDNLKAVIEKVTHESAVRGSEVDCCQDNKFFAMVCGVELAAVSTKAGVGEVCENDDACEEGLVCAKDGQCHETMQAGDGPCGKDGDCADGLVCGPDDKCIERLAAGAGPCGEDGDCADGLVCGEGSTCIDQAAADAAQAAADKAAADKAAKDKADAGAGDADGGADGAGGDDDDDASSGAGGDASSGADGDADGAGDKSGGAGGDADGSAGGAGGDADGGAGGDDDDDAAGAAGGDAGAGGDPATAGDGINALNEAAKANHDQTKASMENTEAATAEEVVPRKMEELLQRQ